MKRSIKIICQIVTGLILPISLFAQNTSDSEYHILPNTDEIEADFLTSYYQQDGDNAAVTGGTGTEELSDFANVFTINIPLDSVNAVSVYAGADYYSSASTDNIDNVVSSASSQDSRVFATFSYNRKNLQKNEIYGVHAGFSKEYDYTSFSTGLSYTKLWNEGNTEINVNGQAFFDQWKLIYPSELRYQVSLPSAGRQSYNGQLNFSQVLNKRMQFAISAELVYMTGLLSTPFHRVYFSDSNTPDIERLPDTRLKIPIGFRFNYYPFDNLILRSYYRFYSDDFGITANTTELELLFKINNYFIISPFYRYHDQSASDYFAPFETHTSDEAYYTSDYDLSALSSNKFGLGIKYSPLYGILRSKPMLKNNKVFMVKYLETRGGYYSRTTGLNAYFFSLHIGFSLK